MFYSSVVGRMSDFHVAFGISVYLCLRGWMTSTRELCNPSTALWRCIASLWSVSVLFSIGVLMRSIPFSINPRKSSNVVCNFCASFVILRNKSTLIISLISSRC